MKSQGYKNLLLIVPVILFWYLGLFLTVMLWYPRGLDTTQWQAHVFHFSLVYTAWFIIFFIYSLFDLQTVNTVRRMFPRLVGAIILCTLVAIVYFYFQPQLLITPRRFLLIHVLISGVGILSWYWILYKISPLVWQSNVFVYKALPEELHLQQLVVQHGYAGLVYNGVLDTRNPELNNATTLVVLPPRAELNAAEEQDLFSLRRSGVQFVEYHDLFERLTRTIHLSVLSELWFIHSVDYGSHKVFDVAKRVIDITLGLVGTLVFLVTFPILALLIKLTSRGPVLFVQNRVGLLGHPFTLYKYRSMTTTSSSNTWANSSQQITALGKIMRATRLDELPQSINILKGDMSIVGPRPEQVNIVEQLREQIPYYDERHIVKPGLTGWSQLHVYASSLEETKRKLQYDLYYIKHRSLLFDGEIILKTIYNIISFSGR